MADASMSNKLLAWVIGSCQNANDRFTMAISSTRGCEVQQQEAVIGVSGDLAPGDQTPPVKPQHSTKCETSGKSIVE